ncbi:MULTISPECIES: hypothetical protein [unclassified Rhizobium]|uniref:hypothetical protein n=1 Tax=unclassified Rhizobium TaxID=2613769 RepID=UPI001EEFC112|nr:MULTISPECIES: hypothetical protein [unclassified Rhizobium]
MFDDAVCERNVENPHVGDTGRKLGQNARDIAEYDACEGGKRRQRISAFRSSGDFTKQRSQVAENGDEIAPPPDHRGCHYGKNDFPSQSMKRAKNSGRATGYRQSRQNTAEQKIDAVSKGLIATSVEPGNNASVDHEAP